MKSQRKVVFLVPGELEEVGGGEGGGGVAG